MKDLEHYIAAADVDLNEDLPLFRALSSPRTVTKVWRHGLSYIRAREIIKDGFTDTTDVPSISLHSLRAGGATTAANAGIADRLFKRHGRWQSENATDGYVKDNFSIVTFNFQIFRTSITSSPAGRRVSSIGLRFFLCVTATSAVRFFSS